MLKSYMVISVINGLYEQLIQNNDKLEYGKQGIIFKCDISSECFGYEHDGNTYHEEWCGNARKYVWVMILKGNRVFVNITDENIYGELPQKGWKNTSNHQSCWRSGSDDITYVGFDVWDEAHKNCPDDYKPATRDEDISFNLNHGIVGNIFKIVEAELQEQDDGYHYNVVSVKEIDSDGVL